AGGARTGVAAYLFSRGIGSPLLALVPARLDEYGGADYVAGLVLRTLARYRGRVRADALVQAALSGETSALHDPYTLLFHPQAFRRFGAFLDRSSFGGIGAILSLASDRRAAILERTIPGSPADRGGLRAGDRIVAVDGRAAAFASGSALVAALRGKAGTTVRVTYERDCAPSGDTGCGPQQELMLVRAAIRDPEVDAHLLPESVGYARLERFGAGASTQLRAALADLQRRGARTFVLDLRADGGGYGDEATAVASLFIASGTIFSTRERSGTTTLARASGDPPFGDVPLVVLVDGDTASASEIVAGALQDDARAKLVGTRTFGKGVVQSVFPLPDGSALKLTTATYATPAGRDIEGTGIAPDLVVPEPAGATFGDPAHDPQLARALALFAPA
ncbi:MAG: S41 family peptidase, partial [Vulcanimicrobiaceae bacterium]